MLMQQIMEMLVEMKATADAYQEKMDADREERKADQENMAAKQEDLLARMDEMNADANAKATKQEEILAEINAKMDATIQSIWSEFQETIHNRVKNVGAEHSQKTEANTEKFEQDPVMMQSVEKHRDVPMEEVAVMPVKGLKKRRRGRKWTAG
jgi:hypothetical protein